MTVTVTRTELILPERMAADMLAQAVLARPQECVGFVGGATSLTVGGPKLLRAELLAPARNRSPTPETHFFVPPHEAFKIEEAFFKRGVDLLGYYHSHPTRDAEPSKTDLALATDRLMVIVPLGQRVPRLDHIRAWQNGEEAHVRLS